MVSVPEQSRRPRRPRGLRAILAGSTPLLIVLMATHATASAAASAPQPAAALPLGLEQTVALALQNSELLNQMTEAIAGAEADALAAASGRLPHLNLGAEYTANLVKPVFFLPPELADGFGGVTKVEMGRDHSLQGAVSLTWNLWTAGRLSASVGAARELVTAGQWQHKAAADAVRFHATAAYLDALLAAQRVRIAEDALATTAEAERIARAGHQQGTISRFDLLRAEVELANRQVPLIQTRNAQRQAELMLLRLCGLEPASSLALTDTLAAVTVTADDITPVAVEALVVLMREHSPELRALQHQVAAARQAVSLARAARGPIVQAHGRYGLQAEWDHDIAPSSEERATSAGAGLAVAMPIFDGRQTQAGIQGAAARLRMAELELERLDRDRELAVRQASLQLASALAALQGRRENVALAHEAHRLAAVRLQNGLATSLERLDAELALTHARVQLAESLHACNLARAAVVLAVGGDPETLFTAASVMTTRKDLR